MVFYRACPKCKGDMDTRRYLYGSFIECIQCGLLQDLAIKSGDAALAFEMIKYNYPDIELE